MPEDRTKRLFLALNMPPGDKIKVSRFIGPLSIKYPAIHWLDPAGLHITLHFLGDISLDFEEKIKARLALIEGKFREPIYLSYTNLGAFPGPERPRIIFLGCRQLNGQSVYNLHQELALNLTSLGIGIDKRQWQPHITLGRVKDISSGQIKFDKALALAGDFAVLTFELMSSNLSPAGAIYEKVASYSLMPVLAGNNTRT
jgi:2'-5' RNA ligase